MIRILIVEDEKPISELMRLSLTKAGYSCHCAYDGAQAADILEKEIFDLVLLDVMLPKYSGFELMEYIRPSGTPVIFITARNSVDDRVKGLRMERRSISMSPQVICSPVFWQRRSTTSTRASSSMTSKGLTI